MAEQPIPVPRTIEDPRVSRSLAAVVVASLSGDSMQRPRARAWVDVLAA
jgi:hypothetical protein